MSKLINELSVFFPAYNLEGQIENTVEYAFNVIPKLVDRYEIIVINDGSKDKTGRILTKLSSKYSNLRVITHEINRGYGAALKSGFYNAKYPWIVFTDGDGQFKISEVSLFLDKQGKTGADLVIGFYRKRQVSTFKIITSKVWELMVFILFGLRVRDIDCGFKLISKKVIDQIPKLESERGAFISSELLIKAKRSGFKITEIGVTHYPRSVGKGTGRDLNVIIKSFIDLVNLWRKLR
jgi:glycosyltransferase involved in cell wall biosynthesis